MRIAVAEAFGTGFLVMGCGTAIIAGSGVGTLGISIGIRAQPARDGVHDRTDHRLPHQPAVTLGLLAIGKTKKEDVPYYIVGQIVGCIVALTHHLIVMAKGVDGFSSKNNFAQNGYDTLLAQVATTSPR